MTVTFKDLNIKKNQLGQFMTPDVLSEQILKDNYDGLIIEPSFGTGSFLYKLEKQYTNTIGIEYDTELYNQYTGTSQIYNQSFYTFNLNKWMPTTVSIIGNPPYRTPAISLKSNDKERIKQLVKKYNLIGIKEEAVFFIAHAIDIILDINANGIISFILPKTLFENNSNGFKHFRTFLNKYAPVISITDINDYPEVSQTLCHVKFIVNRSTTINLTDSLVLNDTITFQQIFKRTYLGSIPCESLFLSSRDESKNSFIFRMVDIFQNDTNIKDGLQYNGKYHLRALNNGSAEKFSIIQGYVDLIKANFSLNEFANPNNYFKIQHRTEERWYFRHSGLSKLGFIYLLNSNPCNSFYFPGNPSRTSTDYFGYCEYDCNRNSSPGANRTIPIDNIEDNIHDSFKLYWKENTNRPITDIFEYILYISKSSWYKEYKAKHQRFYFGIPKIFDDSFD